MTPKEKAQELVDKFRVYVNPLVQTMDDEHLDNFYKEEQETELAIKCALIAVDFAIEAIGECFVVAGYPLEGYRQIKEEINKL